MQAAVKGTTIPLLEVSLDPGESLVGESGELTFISAAVQMRTGPGVGGQPGGLLGGVRRAIGGGTFFMTEYTAAGAPGMVMLNARMPGQILRVEIDPAHEYLVHRHGFLAATSGVRLDIGFQRRLGAGIFGGMGLVMQRVKGQGTAWIEMHGEVVSYDLQPGNTLRVHPGYVAMLETRVEFGIVSIGGITNRLFGANSLYLAALTGPGRVWLQSLPISHWAHTIGPYLAIEEGRKRGGLGGELGGGLLEDILGG